MAWRVISSPDEEGNACVYIQNGYDRETRELHDMVEADIKHLPEMVKQLQAYVEEAEAICEERNAEEDE